MAGITRINITSQLTGRGSYRFDNSRKLYPIANHLYRQIFSDIGSALEDGDTTEDCDLDSYKAGYDYFLGIDTILRTKQGQILTLQEKFLFTEYNTVTIEYMQNATEQGDWYRLKCHLYFVGYDYPQTFTRFASWILLDWAQVVLATQNNTIKWFDRRNQHDGAKASFKYASFMDIPEHCVVARGGNWNKKYLTRR